jgi:hypothetical protein
MPASIPVRAIDRLRKAANLEPVKKASRAVGRQRF